MVRFHIPKEFVFENLKIECGMECRIYSRVDGPDNKLKFYDPNSKIGFNIKNEFEIKSLEYSAEHLHEYYNNKEYREEFVEGDQMDIAERKASYVGLYLTSLKVGKFIANVDKVFIDI